MPRNNRRSRTQTVVLRQPSASQQLVVVQPRGARARARPRRRLRKQRRKQLGGVGLRRGGMAEMLASHIACGSQVPMRFPDGTYAPSLPYQCRARYQLVTNAAGSAAVVCQPDDWIYFAVAPNGIDGQGVYDWSATTPSPTANYVENQQMTLISDEMAQYRTLAVRACGKYTGATGTDGGTVYVKSGLPDWQAWGSAMANLTSVNPGGQPDQTLANVYPNSVDDPTLIDFTAPLREGFELILQPADPTTRKYRSPFYNFVTEISTSESDLDKAVWQLQLEQGDRWPWFNVTVVGATPNSSVMEIEVVIDFELQLRPGFLGLRSMQSSPPDNPAVRAALGNAYRHISDVGANIASRAATTAVGGIQNFILNAITGGASALGSKVGTGLSMLMMSRMMRRPMGDYRLPSNQSALRLEL